jgi:hypothetical protein
LFKHSKPYKSKSKKLVHGKRRINSNEFQPPEKGETKLRSKLAEKVKNGEKGEKRGTPHVL